MTHSFLCTFNNDGILTSLRDPSDTVWNTNFLLSLGELTGTEGISVSRQWIEDGESLLLTFTLCNDTSEAVSLSRMKLRIDANTSYVREQRITYYERVMQHACLCGNSSFLYWHRPSGEGRFLAMIGLDEVSLVQECHESPYAVRFSPIFLSAGEEKTLSFRLMWMEGHSEIQELLVKHDGVGVTVFPGMVIPADMTMKLRIDCALPVTKVSCESGTLISSNAEAGLYELRFSGVGERLIRISYGQNRETHLLCYATRPLETLMDSAARHLVRKQQYRGEAWYDGLFSQWSMAERRMTTPDDTMGLPLYCVSADDPGLCKAPFLAEKNVFRPDPKEIEAIEYYVDHFLWGGLQRTDREEPFPWGVIGSDTWKANRESPDGWGTSIGQERMWRTFDYTHLIQLYWNLYRIARAYPEMVHSLDADGYLERARKTALAFFEVPYSIYMHDHWDFTGWTDWAFKQGNFHERYIVPLLDECHDETLRDYWEAKVKYMIYANPFPYGSEMWFDTTAFESTQAAAHYALLHGLSPDKGEGWFDKNRFGPGKGGWRKYDPLDETKHREFLERQMTANLACRGTQMRDYTLQGSDLRCGGYHDYRLSYMSQMGGAAVLDYALYFAEGREKTAELLRIGYASLLSSWALVNTGADDPFHPHADNEGAAGWAFQPEENGRCFTGLRCPRGPWKFDGEIHSGLSGAMAASCSILADDPAFGVVCFGGSLTEDAEEWCIRPTDGVGLAFHDLHNLDHRQHLILDRDALGEIRVHRTTGAIRAYLRNVTGDTHETTVTLNGNARKIDISGDGVWIELH